MAKNTHEERLQPAIAMLELASIAEGVRTGDAMVKRAPVDVIYAGTVHPGKYLVLVGGDVASVEEALAGAQEGTREQAACTLDTLYLPDAHEDVIRAVRGHRETHGMGESFGVFETATICAAIRGADAGCKGADITLRDIHLADDLGGKAYCVFQGPVAEVEVAIELAEASLDRPELLAGSVVIPQLADEMRDNLDRAMRFGALVRDAD